MIRDCICNKLLRIMVVIVLVIILLLILLLIVYFAMITSRALAGSWLRPSSDPEKSYLLCPAGTSNNCKYIAMTRILITVPRIVMMILIKIFAPILGASMKGLMESLQLTVRWGSIRTNETARKGGFVRLKPYGMYSAHWDDGKIRK